MTYTNERVIGHHIEAEVPEPSEFSKQLTKIGRRLDITRQRPDFVTITESDVGWDDTRKVRLTRRELHEIAAAFPPEAE